MAMIGPPSFARGLDRRGGSAFSGRSFQVPIDVLDDDDRIVDHQADGEHEGQQREQVDGRSRRPPSS